jgi:RHS repeat-associated protein
MNGEIMSSTVYSSDSFAGKPGLFFVLLVFVLLSLSSSSIVAQNPGDNGTPLALAPGSPEGSYALSGFESVNLYNGNLSVSFPALKVGGRGTAGYELQIPIEQKWMVNKEDGYDAYGNYYYSVFPFPLNASTEPSYEPLSVGPRAQEWAPYTCSNGSGTTLYAWHLMTVVVTDADGTEHQLVDQATLGRPTQYPYCTLTGNSRGTVFISDDGSGMTFISDTALLDMNGPPGFSGYLKMRDGTTSRIDKAFHNYGYYSYWTSSLSWMRDPNGNKVTFSRNSDGRLTGITDSLNHYVTIERNVTEAPYGLCDRISYKTSAVATRTIHVSKGNLDTALRSDFQGISTYAQLFPELDDGSGGGSYDSPVITGVWLPDADGVTRRYKFLYNPYGELARVELPTGGAMEYDWEGGLAGGYADGLTSLPSPYGDLPGIYRRVVSRRVRDIGSVLVGSTTYSKPEDVNGNNTVPYVTVSHRDANGHQLSLENHFFFNRASASLFLYQHSPNMIWNSPPFFASPFSSWKDGKEYQTDLYAADGQTLLRRTSDIWEQPSLSWWPASGDAAPSNNPYLKETVSTLSDSGQVTKTTHVNPQNGQTMIDQFNNFTDTWIYDFGQGGPGGLLSHSHTDYLTINPVNGVDYSNRISASGPHMLSLPKQVSVYDSADIERGRMTVEYDNYTVDTNHATLVDRPNISGLDSSFTTFYTTRGNGTAVTHYLLPNSGSISGYTQYDVAGSVAKAIDARGVVSTFELSDCFGSPDGDARANAGSTELNSAGQYSYAFPSIVTKGGLSAHTQFDYYLGRPVDAEDANGTVSSYYFNDVLGRPTQVIDGVNRDVSLRSQKTFSYDDVSRTATATGDQDSYNDNRLKVQTLYDGLGRTVETRTYETGSQYIAVKSVPFVSLQDPDTGVWESSVQSSNPYRPTLGEQPVWTTAFSDALGRGVKVRTPDNAITRNSYSGNTVTGTDQTGRAAKSVSDSLGRVTSIYEDPNGSNYLTNYTYDVFNDLTSVTQGTQPTRTFVYDSLKRLLSASNPERGTTSYQYDNNDNLLVSTDARGVSAHMAYDDLNRPTRRWFNSSNTIGATTNNSPALPSGVIASNEANYFYDSQSLPAGAPSFSRGYSMGRLVAITYGTGASAGDYFGFDALGRGQLKIQQTGGVNYQTTAAYNNGGALKSVVYPSGRSVAYTYDQAGRSTSVAGYLGDGILHTYSTGIIYSPFGEMTKEQFGTDTPIFNKLWYNVRGQLSEIRDSTTYTSPDDTSWNRGAIVNHYSGQCWGMCGGSNSTTPMTDNNGDLKKQDYWIPGDEQVSNYYVNTNWYFYDGLSRLEHVTETNYTSTTNQSATPWQQAYSYDRFGNRTINQGGTWGGVNNQAFSVDTATNRLGVPSGQSGSMIYDAAGNLTNDTYSGQGQRNYDAENLMGTAWANSQWQVYTYDGSGRRVRRNVNGQETWLVYGLGGELIAEYAANSSTPQKEYGYRNGQLLIVANGQPSAQNVTWTNAVGVSTSGNSLTKTAGAGWGNAGASSTQTIVSGDGYLEFASPGTDKDRVCGLSHGDPDQYPTMNFGLYLRSDGIAMPLENGTYHWEVQVGYSASDVFRVAIEGGSVKYKKNGMVFYTSTIAPTYPLLVDSALFTNGSTINNVTLSTGNATSDIEWLVTDQLGTPRMSFDKTGSLAGTKRHDYLPFGDELHAGQGLRTMPLGYNPDIVRQKFTGYERDNETSLDFAHARYYSSVQGRFSSPDPLMASADAFDPQSWNSYAYVGNNPLTQTDPTGMWVEGLNNAKDPFIMETLNDTISQDPDHKGKSKQKPEEGKPEKGWGNTPDHPQVEQIPAYYLAGSERARAVRNFLGLNTTDEFEFRASGGDERSINTHKTGEKLRGALFGAAVATGGLEYRYVRYGKWLGKNGKMNFLTWGGNQHTGARAIAKNSARALRIAGRFVLVTDVAVTMYQYERGAITGKKAGVDIGFGIVGQFGPPGLIISSVYAGVDTTVSWPAVGRRWVQCGPSCQDQQKHYSMANK